MPILTIKYEYQHSMGQASILRIASGVRVKVLKKCMHKFYLTTAGIRSNHK